MLQIKNLSKIYRPKKGQPVKALDGVSLTFPQTGMVFLLGKSGSGKSTLLNLLGGLDKYSDGEIVIKGKSSKAFRQQDFDSYRNTYLGFIFQEYNVLDEFSVGANIALAIELQERKATDEEVNRILEEVDLKGYGRRRPNELSGGQKQRVAIARALVKSPEIIMADEPTGALDSVTGKQVFDTLKKLSQDKLVIIVSHDREYCEQYADRIIELADGKVIDDVELSHDDKPVQPTLVYTNDGDIEITGAYQLAEQDRLQINEYIKSQAQLSSEVTLSTRRRKHRSFVKTDESKISLPSDFEFRLIKSKLPLKSAAKIGTSSLKHKPFRLIVTVILCVISFTLFGLVATLAGYNHVRVTTQSLVDAQVSQAVFARRVRISEEWGSLWRNSTLSRSDIDTLEENTNLSLVGVWSPGDEWSSGIFVTNFDFTDRAREALFTTQQAGFAEITTEQISQFNFTLYGRLPDPDSNEVAITAYMLEMFTHGRMQSDGRNVYIRNTNDVIGATINISGVYMTVVGVIDTHFDLERFEPILEERGGIRDWFLFDELQMAQRSSLHNVLFVGNGDIQRVHDELIHAGRYRVSTHGWMSMGAQQGRDGWWHTDVELFFPQQIIPYLDINWLGTPRTTLARNEIIINQSTWESLNAGAVNLSDLTLYFASLSYDGGWFDIDKNPVIVGYIRNAGVDGTPVHPNAAEFGWQHNYSFLGVAIFSDEFIREFTASDGDDGIAYRFAAGAMPSDRADISQIVQFIYANHSSDDEYQFFMLSTPNRILDWFRADIEMMLWVFLIVAIVFAALRR